ncbi:MAG TPA: PP2C family protein-serine/threonine phosphatase [Bacteroidota bacterium]|nr:PP2C family protein-serine/threonine phosphatase [Bacteroidota bacterium]
MNQRRLYRTIESFASEHFKTEKELLKHVLNEIVKNEKIDIKGGRIWRYEPSSESYRLIHQIGQIDRLEPGYKIPVAKYAVFLHLADQRSLIANETDPYLRGKGIIKYSATGVGEHIRYKDAHVYQYVLAFNLESIDQGLSADLNIISLAVTSLLRGKKIEQKARLLERDLDKAREIQQSILPEPAVNFYHYEVYGVSIPDRIVGGDFFDYLYSDEDKDRLSIVIGDAASKGFQAASQALYVVGAIRMGISYHTKISSLMSRINKLVNRTFSEEQFVSMFYLELTDNQKGLLLYSNAGHNSPMVYHAQEGTIEMLESTGQILGPFPNELYRVENTNLKTGDIVVMYTDGVSEASALGNGTYGEQRIEEKMREYHKLSAKGICEAIIDDVKRFSRGSDYTDDKTVVVVKRIH